MITRSPSPAARVARRSRRRRGSIRSGAKYRFRKFSLAIRRAIDRSTRHRLRWPPREADTNRQFQLKWERTCRRLLRFGNSSSGNAVKLYCDGDALLDDAWSALQSAQQMVWFEMYTIEPDRVGTRTLELLAAAAKRGCDVRLIVDAVGSSGLTETALKPLRDAGAHVHFYNPILRWSRRVPFLRRDHRKIIIVDGAVGFCGGMNISELYAGPKHGKALFQDCHLRLEGPCIRDFCSVFARSWQRITDERLALPRRSPRVGSTFLQVQTSSGRLGRRPIQRALRLTTRNALRHCYITTPYFVPPLRLIRAMTRAAERGVDVRVLTAGVCDVPIVALAARHIYGRLLRKGVRVYEMFDATLHAKTITIDGVYSTVGSFNLDTWSDKRNLEANVAMVDSHIAEELRELFFQNLEKCKEVTLQTWNKRSWWAQFVHWLAYQFMRL